MTTIPKIAQNPRGFRRLKSFSEIQPAIGLPIPIPNQIMAHMLPASGVEIEYLATKNGTPQSAAKVVIGANTQNAYKPTAHDCEFFKTCFKPSETLSCS